MGTNKYVLSCQVYKISHRYLVVFSFVVISTIQLYTLWEYNFWILMDIFWVGEPSWIQIFKYYHEKTMKERKWKYSRGCYSSKSFLSCCVPYLKFHLLPIYINCSNLKIHSYCCNICSCAEKKGKYYRYGMTESFCKILKGFNKFCHLVWKLAFCHAISLHLYTWTYYKIKGPFLVESLYINSFCNWWNKVNYTQIWHLIISLF